jgi:DNA-binding SARP family transcriptional activator
MRAWRRILFVVEAALVLAGLVLLVRFRPEWPDLPNSLSSPVTSVMVRELALVALWLATGLLLLQILVRSLAAALARSSRLRLPPTGADLPPAWRFRSPRARLAPLPSEPAFPPPFPLIVRPASERDTGQNGHQPPPPSTDLEPRTPGVRVAMLGPLEIATAWPRGRALRTLTQQLLVYLALHRAGASADELADALLPRLGAERARSRIWRALSEARSELGDLISRSGDHYLLDRAAVAIDIDEFESLVARANAKPASERTLLLERALALLRGDPLAGTDYPWAAGDVHHLRARIVDVLHELGELRLAEGNAADALAAAERALEVDADDEPAQRLALRAEAALGLREAVVKRYERLRRRLDKRFGLEPEQETRVLYRRLLSQDTAASTSRVRV